MKGAEGGRTREATMKAICEGCGKPAKITLETYAFRTDFDCPFPWYVSQLPARKGSKRARRDGVDWGYTTKRPGAEGPDAPLPLTPYWIRRFRADCLRVGEVAHFQTI